MLNEFRAKKRGRDGRGPGGRRHGELSNGRIYAEQEAEGISMRGNRRRGVVGHENEVLIDGLGESGISHLSEGNDLYL